MNLDNITIDKIRQRLSQGDIELFPTQKSVCIPTINRIYKKMMHGLKFDDIKVFEDLVCDGHHRYISSLLVNKPIDRVSTHRTSATMKFDWKDVDFVDTEWDTKEKVDMKNKEDADFNNITLEAVLEMIK